MIDPKRNANILRGIAQLEVFETLPDLEESLKESAEQLDVLDGLQQLLSNMPSIDINDSMNLLWVEQCNKLISKIKQA